LLSLSRDVLWIAGITIEASGAVPDLGGGIASVAGDDLAALTLCVLVVDAFEDPRARDVVLGRKQVASVIFHRAAPAKNAGAARKA
jgi:hypothetical protein